MEPCTATLQGLHPHAGAWRLGFGSLGGRGCAPVWGERVELLHAADPTVSQFGRWTFGMLPRADGPWRRRDNACHTLDARRLVAA